MRVEVLDRVDARWRVRVVPPPDLQLRGFTVGLVGEDGLPLGPAVVAAPECGPEWLIEVRGPCSLAPGTIARVILHVEGGEAVTYDVGLARRRGLQAWLAADGLLPVMSHAEPQRLSAAARRALTNRWCWVAPEGGPPACGAEFSAELRDVLSDLGVDVEDVP